jgi:hypothetical protein
MYVYADCSDGDVLPALLLAAPLAAGLAYFSLAHIRWLWHLIGPSRPGQARSQPVPVRTGPRSCNMTLATHHTASGTWLAEPLLLPVQRNAHMLTSGVLGAGCIAGCSPHLEM